MTSDIDAKALIKLLSSINDPITFEDLLKNFSPSGQSPEQAEESKEKLRLLLETAMRLRFLKEVDGFYQRF